jgi:flagellar biosynthetic protein FliQ
MESQFVLQLCRETLVLILVLSGPPLIVSLVVGLVISVFQATTQIQEQTLSFVPKMITVFGVLIITGPWLIAQLVMFSARIFEAIPRISGG